MAYEKNSINTWIDKLLADHEELFDFRQPYNYGAPIAWKSIVEAAVREIAELEDKPQDLQIVQIKEKFGSLRIYVNFSSGVIDDIIGRAEDLAAKICPDCGKDLELGKACGNCEYKRSKFQRLVPPNV